MKEVSMKSKISKVITRCVYILIPLLALAAFGWQQTRDENRGTLGTTRVMARQNQQAAAAQSAFQQLKQQGSHDSLIEAFQAARSRIEPLKTTSIEAPRASNFASNPWQHFRAFFAADSVQVLLATADQSVARWRASLTGYGRQHSQQPVVAVEPVVRENRVEYVRGTLTEWYINDPRGLEQGFTLGEPPAEEDGQMGGSLVLTMAVESDLEPKPSPQGDSITFVSTDGEVRLRYSGLKAWDATGRQLPGRMEASEGKIALVVDDADAVYPVTVDPLIFSETKLTASDGAGIDRFGWSVAISGDTVVVGAPLDDTAAGFDVGSAYVFVRSGSVWSEQAKLTASDAAAFDRFGWSVAISGDTVVVGADSSDSGSAYVFVNVTEADLLISLGVDKTNIRQGDLLTYTITVHNFGPNRAVNTVVNDMLSSGTTFVGASANKGNFTAPPPGQTGTVTWYLGDLLDGDQEAAEIQVTVIVRGRTTITNSATVYSETFDPNLANNSAAITVSVFPGRKK
jgi:uncharacterized repeat protein (TIGR01451 family)